MEVFQGWQQSAQDLSKQVYLQSDPLSVDKVVLCGEKRNVFSNTEHHAK